MLITIQSVPTLFEKVEHVIIVTAIFGVAVTIIGTIFLICTESTRILIYFWAGVALIVTQVSFAGLLLWLIKSSVELINFSFSGVVPLMVSS